jgi:hypothetical protein
MNNKEGLTLCFKAVVAFLFILMVTLIYSPIRWCFDFLSWPKYKGNCDSPLKYANSGFVNPVKVFGWWMR